MTETESPFACDMGAIPVDRRGAHQANIERIFRSVEEVRELPDGFRVRLPNESEVLFAVAEFITLERLCCPFLGLGLEIEREGGAVWLSLTGREGVKPFIIAEVGEHVPISIQTFGSRASQP